MSARLWQVGDVALATVLGEPDVRVFRVRNAWVHVESDEGRRYPSTYSALYDNSGQVTDVRRLLVLDLRGEPASVLAENLKVRADYMRENGHRCTEAGLRDLIRQIEDQTRPPRIPEPTTLAAVVEDRNGIRWTRFATDPADGHDGRVWASDKPLDRMSGNASWDEIDDPTEIHGGLPA